MTRNTSTFRYQPLRPDERILGLRAAEVIRADKDIMASVDGFQAEGLRCAVVFILTPEGDFDDGYTAEESAANERFPFPPVSEAVSSYDPADSLCILLARGSDVTVFVTAREPTKA